MRAIVLLTLGTLGVAGLTACTGGGSLELPTQVQEAGLSPNKRLEMPCPMWCSAGGPVSVITTEDGMPIAFKVSLPPAKWDLVLKDAKGKWGSPASVYKLTPGGFTPKPKPKAKPTGIGKPKPEKPAPKPEPSLTWLEKANKLHNANTPKAMKVLDKGSEYQTNQFAMWYAGNTLVRVDSNDSYLNAWWVRTDRL